MRNAPYMSIRSHLLPIFHLLFLSDIEKGILKSSNNAALVKIALQNLPSVIKQKKRKE